MGYIRSINPVAGLQAQITAILAGSGIYPTVEPYNRDVWAARYSDFVGEPLPFLFNGEQMGFGFGEAAALFFSCGGQPIAMNVIRVAEIGGPDDLRGLLRPGGDIVLEPGIPCPTGLVGMQGALATRRNSGVAGLDVIMTRCTQLAALIAWPQITTIYTVGRGLEHSQRLVRSYGFGGLHLVSRSFDGGAGGTFDMYGASITAETVRAVAQRAHAQLQGADQINPQDNHAVRRLAQLLRNGQRDKIADGLAAA